MKVSSVETPLRVGFSVANLFSPAKCDETRPGCLNCATVARACSYRDNTGGNDALSRASSSGTEKLRIEEEGSKHSSCSPSTLPSATPLPYHVHPARHTPSGPPPPTTAVPLQGKPYGTEADFRSLPPYPPLHPAEPEGDGAHVNMVHMELFHHFQTSTYGFFLPEQPVSRLVRELAVRHAVTSPFLMHQILAFAARHRGSEAGEGHGHGRGRFYRRLAAELQTQAISLFGRVDLQGATTAVHVSIFLFSSFLGIHDLCDALSLRPAGGFPEFMERYLAYVHLHRGVHKVIVGSWDNLRESELRPVLDAGEEMWWATGTGHECDDIRTRIQAAEGLSAEHKEACCQSIRHLQWVFAARPRIETRMNALLAWVPMLQEGFVQLLEARRSEALCVLAYYFLLLHFCRDVWFVCDSGAYLLRLLDEYLGPEWNGWMVRPKELLEEAGG